MSKRNIAGMKENFCISNVCITHASFALKHNTTTYFCSIKFAYMKIPGHYEFSEHVIS